MEEPLDRLVKMNRGRPGPAEKINVVLSVGLGVVMLFSAWQIGKIGEIEARIDSLNSLYTSSRYD